MSISFDKQMLAIEAFQKLGEQVKDVRRLFQDAGMSPPPAIIQFLGDGTARKGGGLWQGPQTPPRPAEAKSDWIWIPAQSLPPVDIALGVLRRENRPMAAVEVFKVISKEFQQEVNRGSLYNVFPRLKAQNVIEDTGDGWGLKQASKASVLYEGNAWGPWGIFHTTSVAAFRRNLIVDLLGSMPGGLMTMQIADHLKAADCYQGPPVTKDLIQDDMEMLQKSGRARRQIGHSKKWVVNDANNEAEK